MKRAFFYKLLYNLKSLARKRIGVLSIYSSNLPSFQMNMKWTEIDIVHHSNCNNQNGSTMYNQPKSFPKTILIQLLKTVSCDSHKVPIRLYNHHRWKQAFPVSVAALWVRLIEVNLRSAFDILKKTRKVQGNLHLTTCTTTRNTVKFAWRL